MNEPAGSITEKERNNRYVAASSNFSKWINHMVWEETKPFIAEILPTYCEIENMESLILACMRLLKRGIL